MRVQEGGRGKVFSLTARQTDGERERESEAIQRLQKERKYFCLCAREGTAYTPTT